MAVEGCCKDLFRGDYDIRGRHGTIKRRLEGPTAETSSRPVGARKAWPHRYLYRPSMSFGSILLDSGTVPQRRSATVLIATLLLTRDALGPTFALRCSHARFAREPALVRTASL